MNHSCGGVSRGAWIYGEVGNGVEYKTQTLIPLAEGSLAAGLEGREMEVEEGSEGGMWEAIV